MSEGGAASTMQEARTRVRRYQERLRLGDATPDYRVGVAASFTAEALSPFLLDGLLGHGLSPAVSLAPYGQVIQACLTPHETFRSASELHAVVLLWRIEELLAAELDVFLAGKREEALAGIDQRLQELCSAIETLRAGFAGTIAASIPPYPQCPEADLLRPLNQQLMGHLHQFVLERWRRHTAGSNLLAFDLDALQRHFGASRAVDARKWYLYRQPYREEFLALLGGQLAGLLSLTRGTPHKCAVVDCDNTLWGGIVGEDGPEGLALGDDFPGAAHRDFQRLLLEWRRGGTLLALLSKNDEAAVWEVFDRRPEMVLRREDIAAWAINWKPKPENLPALTEALKIGPDHMVFFDDAPSEIAAMKAAWPMVECVLMPPDPASIVDHVRSRRLFHAISVTAEDRDRTGMLAAERQRDELRARLSHADFLASLELRVAVWHATPQDVPRVAQLINRTNQFNLTTVRRSVEEVEALRASSGWRLFALSACDRFGDYGTTGVALIEADGPSWRLDTFLLSCRVLGRGVETAFLGVIARSAHETGVRRLRARFVPTAKNAASADFLPRHGFAQGASEEWEASPDAVPPVPAHVRLLY